MAITRAQVADQVGRKMLDARPQFRLDNIDPAIDQVLLKLASIGAISALDRAKTDVTFATSTRSFDIKTLLGLSEYPYTVKSVRVPAWCFPGGALERVSDTRFEARTLLEGTTLGQPTIWRLFPNNKTIEIHHRTNASAAADPVTIRYVVGPTLADMGDALDELMDQDMPAVVAGTVLEVINTLDDETPAREAMLATAQTEWETWSRVMSQRAQGRMQA